MTTATTSGSADLFALIEAYAELRHKQGYGSYNANTYAAWQAVKDAIEGKEATHLRELAAYRLTVENLEREIAAQQPAPSAAPADTVVLNAAMRAIQQAIELIGAPTGVRMRAVRRVLRGAVIVAEDDGKVEPLPSTAYAALPEYGINTASHAHFRVLGFTADQMRAFADATHTMRASHGEAPAQTADSQLLQFYGVTTDAELIAAQAAHIEKLQAKLTKTPSFAPQRVREG